MASVLDLIKVTAPGPQPKKPTSLIATTDSNEGRVYKPVYSPLNAKDLAFRRVGHGWKRLSNDDISDLSIRDVINGPYAFKIDDQYYVGNDRAYLALKEKKPKWIHDSVNENLKACIREGVSWNLLLNSPFSIAYVKGPKILYIDYGNTRGHSKESLHVTR